MRASQTSGQRRPAVASVARNATTQALAAAIARSALCQQRRDLEQRRHERIQQIFGEARGDVAQRPCIGGVGRAARRRGSAGAERGRRGRRLRPVRSARARRTERRLSRRTASSSSAGSTIADSLQSSASATSSAARECVRIAGSWCLGLAIASLQTARGEKAERRASGDRRAFRSSRARRRRTATARRRSRLRRRRARGCSRRTSTRARSQAFAMPSATKTKCISARRRPKACASTSQRLNVSGRYWSGVRSSQAIHGSALHDGTSARASHCELVVAEVAGVEDQRELQRAAAGSAAGCGSGAREAFCDARRQCVARCVVGVGACIGARA